MKKFSILFFAALLVVAFTMPAAALETEFGGYWRTRFFTEQNFSGEDRTEARDFTWVDTRTRLYFTATLNDNLKFVNKFEFDAQWGTGDTGDIGTDGNAEFEIKHSYADFNIGSVNAKLGMQGATVARGFLFDDDFAGAHVTFNGEGFTVPFLWIRVNEGSGQNWRAGTKDDNDDDQDLYVLNPSFAVGDASVNPFFAYWTQDSIDLDVYFVGVNVDAGPIWFTGIYETGDLSKTVEVSAYVAALGVSMDLGGASVNAQVFYATGDDDPLDADQDAYTGPPGICYYWSEIMGWGTFDWDVSNGSPAGTISNIMAANVGASVSPMDKLKLSANLWYAQLAEEDALGNKDLGTEVDLKATYELVEGLNLDVVAAYLFAGDSTTMEDPDDANPYELGARLSLSF